MYLSIYFYIYQSIYLCIYISIFLSSYLSINLSIYQSIYLSIYPHIHDDAEILYKHLIVIQRDFSLYTGYNCRCPSSSQSLNFENRCKVSLDFISLVPNQYKLVDNSEYSTFKIYETRMSFSLEFIEKLNL